jgi:predicted amidophosphoribosyltransferase
MVKKIKKTPRCRDCGKVIRTAGARCVLCRGEFERAQTKMRYKEKYKTRPCTNCGENCKGISGLCYYCGHKLNQEKTKEKNDNREKF